MRSNVIKFLITLKNASILRKEFVCCFYNKLFLKLIKILYKEGLIQDYFLKKNLLGSFQLIISLKYVYNLGDLSTLKIISRPSWTLFLTYNDICKLSEKKSIFFFSTDKGFLTSLECKKYKLGGKLLFYVK